MENDYVKVFAQEILQGFTEDGMYVLLMTDPVAMLQVPILIGEHEAEMIMLEHERQCPKRPMTHQLLLSLCDTFHLELRHVSIDRYFEGIFYASLHVSDGVCTRRIDCRVSDAIALALHENIDMWMSSAIFREAGSKITGDGGLTPAAQPTADPTLQELEQELRRCEAEEDYEKAAVIDKLIEAKKRSKSN